MSNWQNFSTRFCTGIFSFAVVAIASMSVEAQDKIDIDIHYEKGRQYRVLTQYQHDGQMAVDHAGQDSEVKNLTLDVDARIDFHERYVGTTTNVQAVRFYDRAQAEIKIDDGTKTSSLSDSNSMVVARLQSDPVQSHQMASLKDVLIQSELELITNPADPLTLAGLLNKEDVKIGQEWTPDRDDLAKFLNVDRIYQSDIKLKLRESDGKTAKIFMMGKLRADVDDVSTEMDVTSVMMVNLDSHFVSAVRLSVKEVREPGQVAPGFNGKTKVDLQISTGKQVSELTSASISKLTKSRKIQQLLQWSPKSKKFNLIYDPSWKLIASEGEAAILRYLDDGDLLAQCNIVELASRPASNPLTLEDFKKEVAKIVEIDPSARLVNASQSQTAAGLKALVVTVYGEEGGVPLHWVYYNVASPQGRQVTFVFTLEKEIVNRVLPATRNLVNGFTFLQLPKSKSKTASRSSASKTSSRKR
jgi:hypothetical protein